nr:Uncharacterised protein [Klebsiella pneumoniae]
MHVAQRVHRAHRLRLARGLLLMQLNFVGAEATIPRLISTLPVKTALSG